MFPTFNATSCAVIRLTAIGVCLDFAMSMTPEVTTTSCKSTSRMVLVTASVMASVCPNAKLLTKNESKTNFFIKCLF